MPDPNPYPPRSKAAGRGRKGSTKSSPPRDPNPLKVASMVADSVEMAAKVVIPLEVRTGAREAFALLVEDQPHAILDLYNTEDGHEYQVMVMLKPRPNIDGNQSESSSSSK